MAHVQTVSTPFDVALLAQQCLLIQEEVSAFITGRTTRQVSTVQTALEWAQLALLDGGVEEVGEIVVALGTDCQVGTVQTTLQTALFTHSRHVEEVILSFITFHTLTQTITIHATLDRTLLAHTAIEEVIQTDIAFQTMGQIMAVNALMNPAKRAELILQKVICRSVTTGAC